VFLLSHKSTELHQLSFIKSQTLVGYNFQNEFSQPVFKFCVLEKIANIAACIVSIQSIYWHLATY